jgi:hypothetical protein
VRNNKIENLALRSEGRAASWDRVSGRAKKISSTAQGQATKANNRVTAKATQAARSKELANRDAQRAKATTYKTVSERSTKRAANYRTGAATVRSLKVKPSNKGALALGGIAAATGAGAYGMSRMRRGQGRKYTDWWD